MQSETALRNKQVKKALLEHYNKENISVKGDRGTAYGWVNVKVLLSKPKNCNCNIQTAYASWAKVPYSYKYRAQREVGQPLSRSTYMCEACLSKIEEHKPKVEQIVYGCGAKFGHYYADDGYDTKRSEVLIDVGVEV